LNSADQYERAFNGGAWVQIEWTKGIWRLQQVARLDLTRFRLEDLFLDDGDQQGKRTFYNRNIAWFATAALSKEVFCSAGVTSGFESPTLNELTNNPSGDAGLNAALNTEKSWQAEIRLHTPSGKKVEWTATVFYATLRDLIIGYELPSTPGRTYYRNAPQARRHGAELVARWHPNPSIDIEATYAASFFTYTSYTTGAVTYTGNRQPLIPAHRIGVRASTVLGKYVGASCQLLVQSSMFADDANQVLVGQFAECNAELSTTQSFSRKVRIGMTGANLFGAAKYSNIRVNAAAMRYYEAATPSMVSLFIEWFPFLAK
jgi:iron complex outermembrane receptor protein